jgi:hypothetical protein
MQVEWCGEVEALADGDGPVVVVPAAPGIRPASSVAEPQRRN